MNSTIRLPCGLALLLLVVLIYSATFVVQQTSQALVFQFGRVARPPIDRAGALLQVPRSSRTSSTSTSASSTSNCRSQEVIASDQKRLVVDAFTRYRVTDPLRFYQSVRNRRGRRCA